MFFVLLVTGGEGIGQVIYFSGCCVRVEHARGNVGIYSVAIRKVDWVKCGNVRRGFFCMG